ncbi:hypothetical protein QVD17_10575 [Tagetes erecta]|uniref:Uncharacterized protein n=1 Tax=Tagetes erecta TaxID=13708 RepID=A0AAD8L6K8_TARER|nr:hypothetical protein QVD17_10575 [Tagetes erecta]
MDAGLFNFPTSQRHNSTQERKKQTMDESSSKIYGDATAEECQSSESGWTMYIGSSMDDDDDGDGGDDGGGVVYDRKKGVVKDEDDDEDTDDSMASDASSGPNHLQLQPWEVQQDDQSKEKYKSCLNKKLTTGKKKKKLVGYDHEQDQSRKNNLVNEKRCVITTVQSGNRGWFKGKRK